ncbi:MAG: four helix bundle protein [Crocinitomicaceae bacterium]|nr:four helix bundle protein [Crocinitomicaceae bacterium]
MNNSGFEELKVWQLSQDIAFSIYQKFNSNKDFGFKDQIQRAAVSISNNIAEGYDRNYKNEFKRFLWISKASCGEVKSMLFLAERLQYISKDEKTNLLKECDQVSRMIFGLIKSLG